MKMLVALALGAALSGGMAFGWALRARMEKARHERIRKAVADELKRQDQKKRERDRKLLESTRHGIERWTTDRTDRLVEDVIEASAELAEKRRETHGE